MHLHLILGDKNYSSWSMRAWVALHAASIPFEETVIELDTPTALEQKLRHSPAGRVPVLELVEGDAAPFAVWDSLAIVECVAERFPDRGVWPADAADRARARSLCAEMHAGFAALRGEMPMNIRRTKGLRGGVTAAVRADLARLDPMFAAARGPFLLGAFCAADAFFAPVATRLRTYEVDGLSAGADDYVSRLLAHDSVASWCAAARREAHDLPEYDAL